MQFGPNETSLEDFPHFTEMQNGKICGLEFQFSVAVIRGECSMGINPHSATLQCPSVSPYWCYAEW